MKGTIADRFYFTKRGPHLLKVSDINGDSTVRVNLGVAPFASDLVSAYRSWRDELKNGDQLKYEKWQRLESEMVTVNATHSSIPFFTFVDHDEEIPDS